MDSLHVLVVGAGLGGLAAAIALRRQGHRVSVFEQAPAIGEIGAGIMLTPNAVAALGALGAMDRVRPLAVEPQQARSRHFQTGETLGVRPVAGAYEPAHGHPMYNIHRADLHRALAETLRDVGGTGVELRLGHALSDVRIGGRAVEVRFTNGLTYQGDVLIGADGIRSVVRRNGLGLDQPPRFTGMVAWRGLVPLDRLPEALRSTSMTSWTSPDRHIIEYAVGDLKNYVAMAMQPGWEAETWSTPSSVEEVLAHFPGWHPDITEILKATPQGGSFKYALFDRDPLPQWGQGRVTLLGDAAHATLPLMAQGAAMAFEDAVVLARAFAAAGSVEDALKIYEDARRERTAWVQLKSRTALEYYHSTDKGKWQSDTAERQNVLYNYDASTIAI